MVVSKSHLVIPADFGDSVSATFVDRDYVVCGTLLGKIWLYKFDRNSRILIAGYSDDSVRGVYVEDGTIFATIGDQCCKRIQVSDPIDQLETKFDRRSSSSGFKYVIQKFNQVTIVYPGMTTFVDVSTNEQNMCPFKMQQPLVLNICPLDAFQNLILLSEFPSTSADPSAEEVRAHRKLKIVDVAAGLTRFELVEPMVTLAQLINDKIMIYCVGNTVLVFNFVEKKQIQCLKRLHGGSAILALDSCLPLRGPEPLTATLAKDGSVRVWDFLTGTVLLGGDVSNFCFSLGFPYLLQVHLGSTPRAVVSSDYGAHVVDLCYSENVSPIAHPDPSPV